MSDPLNKKSQAITKEEFLELESICRRFFDLDIKKTALKLTPDEESKWTEFHGIIMADLFNQEFHDYLDRRHNIRVHFSDNRLGITILTQKKKKISSSVIDLSVFGVATPYHSGIAFDEVVEIHIPTGRKKTWGLFGEEVLKLSSKSSWVTREGGRMGFLFQDPSESDQKLLLKMVYDQILYRLDIVKSHVIDDE